MLKLFVVLIVYLFMLPTLASAQSSGQMRSTVDLIVIHTIGGPSCQNSSVVFQTIVGGDAKWWLTHFKDHETIGIHYVIGRNGETLAGIQENEIANHAYGNNQTSIGIELVNNGDGSDPFPPEISALIKLLRELCSRYELSVDKIKGHEEIDKRMFQCGSFSFKEKVDPGLAFPWQEVREALTQFPVPGSPIVTKKSRRMVLSLPRWAEKNRC